MADWNPLLVKWPDAMKHQVVILRRHEYGDYHQFLKSGRMKGLWVSELKPGDNRYYVFTLSDADTAFHFKMMFG